MEKPYYIKAPNSIADRPHDDAREIARRKRQAERKAAKDEARNGG